jgi:hypothetical protein
MPKSKTVSIKFTQEEAYTLFAMLTEAVKLLEFNNDEAWEIYQKIEELQDEF